MSLPSSKYVSDCWRAACLQIRSFYVQAVQAPLAVLKRMQCISWSQFCIVGRNFGTTECVAQAIATSREGAKAIGIGGVDVRKMQWNTAAGAAGNFLASIEQLSVNAFKSVMNIDVLGSYNTLKATIPHLTKSAGKNWMSLESLEPSPDGTGGRIIFVSATLHYTGKPFQTHASVAKAGLDALSHNVAIEYGPRGVTSNIIAPGYIWGTEGVDRLIPSEAKAAHEKSQPLGRFGHFRDIADATVYLFSHAGSYVTGQVLVVDGASWRTSCGDTANGSL